MLDSANLLNENLLAEASTSQPIIEQSADPESLQRGKKRIRNAAGWSSNIKKSRRNGKAYMSSTNKSIPERAVKPPCQDKCKLKCKTKTGEILRKTLLDRFWGLGDLQEQREFIVRHTQEIKPKYKYSSTQNYRSLNSAFFFEVEDIRIRVCNTFFKATLNLSDQFIRTALSKR